MFFSYCFSFWLSLKFPEYFCRTLFQDFFYNICSENIVYFGGGPGAQVSFVVNLDSGFLQLIHKIMIIHWNSGYSILSENPDTLFSVKTPILQSSAAFLIDKSHLFVGSRPILYSSITMFHSSAPSLICFRHWNHVKWIRFDTPRR